MKLLLVLPIAIPLAGAAAGLAGWRLRRAQGPLALLVAFALLGAAVGLLYVVARDGILAVAVGGWPAPFGISLVADLFAALMVLVTAIVALAVVAFSSADVDPRRKAFGYYPMVNVLLAGVCGAFLTGDLFNLFVWFEVMLIASFVLLALGGERAQLEGAIKYVTLNLVSSVLFLAAVGLLYGATGTLNMAHLHLALATIPGSGLVAATAAMLLVAFGIKAAVFPLFFWLPASYHTPPAAVSALFAGLLTKVGVYALIRAFTLLFTPGPDSGHETILVLAGFTMVTGVAGAAVQTELRRILSFHIISQIGYMIMGLGLHTRLALAGSVFYIVHHIVVKTNLFLVSGVLRRRDGSYQLAELGGGYRRHAGLAVLFLVPALSLAGMPPLSGFFAKLTLAEAGLAAGRPLIVAVALVVGLLTLFSMTKIWAAVFWKPPPTPSAPPPAKLARERPAQLVAIAGLGGVTLLLSLWPAPWIALALDAADQLLDPSGYVAAVLGAGS